MLILTGFFVYNLWQLRVSFKVRKRLHSLNNWYLQFYQHVQLLNELELPTKKEAGGSSGSSVALNFSNRESPSPPLAKRSVGGTSAIIFVNGIDGHQLDNTNNMNVHRHNSVHSIENRRFV
jgi:hypothetical protein